MLDSAVTWFGITIENALQETVKVVVGKETKNQPRYTLAVLLNERFRLPRPKASAQQQSLDPFAALAAYAGKRGSKVKRYQYVAPQ